MMQVNNRFLLIAKIPYLGPMKKTRFNIKKAGQDNKFSSNPASYS